MMRLTRRRHAEVSTGSGLYGPGRQGCAQGRRVEATRRFLQHRPLHPHEEDVDAIEVALGDSPPGAPEPFDLVLADPPYSLGADELRGVLARLTTGWLAAGAVVMVERGTKGGEFAWPERLTALRHSSYGETTLWYGLSAPDREDR